MLRNLPVLELGCQPTPSDSTSYPLPTALHTFTVELEEAGFQSLPSCSKEELPSGQPGSNRWNMALQTLVLTPSFWHWLMFEMMAWAYARLSRLRVCSVKVEGCCPCVGIRRRLEILRTVESAERFLLLSKPTTTLERAADMSGIF